MVNTTLLITINKDKDDTSDDIAQLSQQLRNELLGFKVESIEHQRNQNMAQGTKAVETISWETLIVTLAASGGIITTIINFILAWVKRNEGRSVTLELNGNKLEVTGLSSNEQKVLIETWLKRTSKTQTKK